MISRIDLELSLKINKIQYLFTEIIRKEVIDERKEEDKKNK